MAIVLPKADTREWFEREILTVLRHIAADDWDALPVSTSDEKKRLSWFQNARSLLTPIVILVGLQIVKHYVRDFPSEAFNYSIFCAWAFLGLSAVSVLDPKAAEMLLKLKDLPKVPFDGKSKE